MKANPEDLFLAKTASASEWKAVSSAIKTLVEEATFEATSEALSFRAMDPSHVALVDLLWPNVSFERYECDKPFKFSLRVEDFVKLIGRSDTKDSVEISSTEEDMIMMKFMNGYKREFTIHLIESSAATAPLPKLEFDTKISLTKSVFEKVLSDISVVSDQVTIQAANDKLSFSGKSDIGAASVQLDKTGADILELQVKAESKGTYNIDYLLAITKAISTADTLTCEYSSKKPVKLDFKLNEQGARIHYFLAPRVSSD
ncbi:MAG: proliferating cell nuclear antigen (pcna) [Thaumarchaeota archaeon]|nr:proliferating cell nuclear antigen (pcna) [Nitrososphaerota archaeon]